MCNVDAVVIGRNEEARLEQCLLSLEPQVDRIIYVDSGSTDGSLKIAYRLADKVISLDPSEHFTAARGRNAGFEVVLNLSPQAEFVQFVDGDCTVNINWISNAKAFLNENPDYAIVCGRRLEEQPDQTIYNFLCHLEWNTPVGDADACGGDALIRLKALEQIHGYNPNVIAAEDDEMCLRIRRQGWKIARIEPEMTYHDAALTNFRSWWKRMVRGGYAFSMGFDLHGYGPEKYFHDKFFRTLFWGIILPLIIVVTMIYSGLLGLLFLAIYPIQILRIALNIELDIRRSLSVGYFLTIGKFAEAYGMLKYFNDKLLRRKSQIIEYKV